MGAPLEQLLKEATSPAEAQALRVHAGMLRDGFEPCTESEDGTASYTPLPAQQALPSTRAAWAPAPGMWVFRYRHERTCLKYTLKVVEMSPGKLAALLDNGSGQDKVLCVTVPVHVQSSQQTQASANDDKADATDKAKDATGADVDKLVKSELVDKAFPCSPSGTSGGGDSKVITGAPPVQPRVPPASGSSSSSTSSSRPFPNPMFDYGRSDLVPGGVDPYGRGFGGNLVGPEAFSGRGGTLGGWGPAGGPTPGAGQYTPDGYFPPELGGDEVHPPPPGARYDPVYPDDPFQFGPRGFPRGGGGRGPGGFFGGGGGNMFC